MYPVYVAPPADSFEYKGEKANEQVLTHYNGLINLSQVYSIKKTSENYLKTKNGNSMVVYDVFGINFSSSTWLFDTEEERDAEYTRVSNIALAIVPAVLKPIMESREL